MELAYRLPRLWNLVQALRVPAWRARAIAQLTITLSPEAAAFADRLIAADPDHLSRVRAAQLVEEARLYFDPDLERADEENDANNRGVWLHRTRRPGSTDVHMRLDTLDAKNLDDTLSDVAVGLRKLGDNDSLDQRRAKAAGILADPQFALDILSGRSDEPEVKAHAPAEPPARSRRKAVLHLHVGADDLAHDAGGTIEGLGPATLQLLADWLDRTDFRVAPVLDIDRGDAVNRHDPPPGCASCAVCETSPASSPAAPSTPGSATSTTSPSTSRWQTAAHPDRPARRTSLPSAAATTG